MTWRALHAIYTIAFICMLRSDEVLKTQMEHLEILPMKVILTLPFRKTHQFGGKFLLYFLLNSKFLIPWVIEVKPFMLYPLAPEVAHLCAFHAIAEWIKASNIMSGYLFQRMASGDRPSAHDTAMVSQLVLHIQVGVADDLETLQTSEKCLEMFHLNLLDIGIDPSPYRTHLFRRGGCQYFSSVRR